MNLKEYIVKLIQEENSTSGGESYNSKKFLKKTTNEIKIEKPENIYKISSKGKDIFKTYVIEKIDGTHLIDMEFDSIGKAKEYANKKGIKLKIPSNLNEVSYRSFNKNISSITPQKKITRAIKEIKKKINEINKITEYSSKILQENDVKNEQFWIKTNEQLNEIAKDVVKTYQKVKKLNK